MTNPTNEREMKTHDDIVDNLIEQLAYLDTLPDFNESCTTLYICEAITTINKQRAELDALRLDAERYQWLNSNFDMLAYVSDHNDAKHYRLKCGKYLDKYIDEQIDKARTQS